MNVIRYTDANYQDRLREAIEASSSLFDPKIEATVRRILQAVQKEGDQALYRFARKFDKVDLETVGLRVSEEEIQEAQKQVAPAVRSAIRTAEKNIILYAKQTLRKSWTIRNAQGARVGEKFDPYERVGVYVPGGTAPLVSTVLMTALLGKVAGCREIVLCTPCRRDGTVHPALLYAAQRAGVTEIYRVGGAQAIAAMALGTETIRPVQKLFGPGNAYVVCAKRLLFGYVAVDLLPGPSELLILADETAPANFIAADLLAQAEHGSGYERVWLVTPSARLIEAVQQEVDRQLPELSRQDFVKQVLQRNGWCIQTADWEEAVKLANRIAPEHCEVMVKRPAGIVRQLKTAGAVFIGPWSPTALGDYIAGPSHTLPTGGAGRSFSGLTADQFQRSTSLVEYSQSALRQSLPALTILAELEGLDAHARSAQIRLRKKIPSSNED